MGTVSIREVTLGLCVRSATVECTLTWLTPHQARWQNMNVFSEGETYRKEGEFKIRGRETDRVNGRGLGLPACTIVSLSVRLSVFLSFCYLQERRRRLLPSSFPCPGSRPPRGARASFPLPIPTRRQRRTAPPRCGLLISSRRFARWMLVDALVPRGAAAAAGDQAGERDMWRGAAVIGCIMAIDRVQVPPPMSSIR